MPWLAAAPGAAATEERVRSAAAVASAARPIDPPIWREVLSTPEASPAWLTGTPEVAAPASGVNSSPSARAMRQPGPSMWAR